MNIDFVGVAIVSKISLVEPEVNIRCCGKDEVRNCCTVMLRLHTSRTGYFNGNIKRTHTAAAATGGTKEVTTPSSWISSVGRVGQFSLISRVVINNSEYTTNNQLHSREKRSIIKTRTYPVVWKVLNPEPNLKVVAVDPRITPYGLVPAGIEPVFHHWLVVGK